MTSWACQFYSDLELEPLAGQLNEKGVWRWVARDSAWWGEYLQTRPAEGVRIRIFSPAEANGVREQNLDPAAAAGGTTTPSGPPHEYVAQFDLDSTDATAIQGIHDTFHLLLTSIFASEPRVCDTWD
jgi:hypothetical protein